ncbi:hypothetical protein EDC04DRAFT_385421 [Pisolithus marmoratus]|nr:hypothetical protein EDC04DRAFT_385421 [Pisolithus marmoratus]
MKDFPDVRAKLGRLKHRGLAFLRKVFDTRKAVAAREAVIDQTHAVSLIDRLPNELLIQIFLLIRDERQILASVSSRLRAVVIGTPRIWSEIDVGRYYGGTRWLELHLERSRQVPLTISLYDDHPELDVALLHANRWRTLRILRCTRWSLSKISDVNLPSLQYLSIGIPASGDLLLMVHSCAPVLKCLEHGEGHVSLPRTLFRKFITESLEELSLTGATSSWESQQTSMHFPSLQRLALCNSNPMSFLEAILAPKLTYFSFVWECGAETCTRTYNEPLDELRSKFDNVTHLTLTLSPSQLAVGHVPFSLFKNLCRVFHGTRLADIHADYIPALFTPSQMVENPNDRCAIDDLTCLESLHIRSFPHSPPESFEHLKEWLMKRRNLGQRKLHFKLTHVYGVNDPVTLDPPFMLRQTFEELCASVELDRVSQLSRTPLLPTHCCEFTDL